MVALTIGMPTYNDFDGVYFTLQALRLYQDLEDTELLVIDNYGCDHTQRFVEGWVKARYIRATEAVGTATAKNRVFAEARGEAVLCCDSHVLFAPGTIARLKAYYQAHPGCRDLLQGPLLADDLETIFTHFDPVWLDEIWGIWATDPRGADPEGEPFEIPMQGMGVFSCRKEAWPGFNPAFRGFGGEEGYIHEKVRQAGGRCLCLPWLRWGHRFGRPAGVPYPALLEDKVRNYIIGHTELGLDLEPVRGHFSERLTDDDFAAIVAEALQAGISAPPKLVQAGIADGLAAASAATAQAVSLPLVSCICQTYNRPPDHQYLPEEAIESFLRQTYPNKELIVLNDCPGQELVCDAPGVRVVNVPERFPTLGDKHNAAIALARGQLIAPWDDDDISLPWRLSLSVKGLGDAAYFNPKRYWRMDRDKLRSDPLTNVGHNLSLFTRAAFDVVGGYPSLGSGVDLAMDLALRAQVACVGAQGPGHGELAPRDLYYIYRWGVSPAHLSAAASDEERAANYQRIGMRPVQEGRFLLRPHWRVDYVAESRRLAEAAVSTNPTSPTTGPRISDVRPVSAETRPRFVGTDQPMAGRRAIVCFVEDRPHLIQQLLALRLSWRYTQSPDTDLVVMGPADVLARLPDDLVKIAQQPAADDPVWRGYRYVNAIASLNGAGAEQLDGYSHILRTDVDTFITPAWNAFYPTTFTHGKGGYSNDDDVRQRIRDIAARYGLVHRGMTNVGSTWYGPPEVVRRAAAFAELLTEHLLTHHFACHEGQWPGWFRGVSGMYAGEIAVNHCAPEAQRSELLDAASNSGEAIDRYPHIHCLPTKKRFSKHAFMAGKYTPEDAHGLDMTIVRDYCLALALRSLPDAAGEGVLPTLTREPIAHRVPALDEVMLAVGGVTPEEAQHVADLLRARGVPDDMGIEDALAAGLVTLEEFAAALGSARHQV